MMTVKSILGEMLEIDPTQVKASHLSTYSMYWFNDIRLLPTPDQERILILAQLKRG